MRFSHAYVERPVSRRERMRELESDRRARKLAKQRRAALPNEYGAKIGVCRDCPLPDETTFDGTVRASSSVRAPVNPTAAPGTSRGESHRADTQTAAIRTLKTYVEYVKQNAWRNHAPVHLESLQPPRGLRYTYRPSFQSVQIAEFTLTIRNADSLSVNGLIVEYPDPYGFIRTFVESYDLHGLHSASVRDYRLQAKQR